MLQHSREHLVHEFGLVISTLKTGTCLVDHRMRLYLLKYKLQARIDYLGDDFPNQDLLPISMADKRHSRPNIRGTLSWGIQTRYQYYSRENKRQREMSIGTSASASSSAGVVNSSSAIIDH